MAELSIGISLSDEQLQNVFRKANISTPLDVMDFDEFCRVRERHAQGVCAMTYNVPLSQVTDCLSDDVKAPRP